MKSRILIKIGGRAFEGEKGFRELAAAIKSQPTAEIIIVHGGGAEISRALKTAGRKTRFVDGIRVTRAADIKIVEDVLTGTINRRIVSWLRANGIPCRGMSGKTGQLLIVQPLTRGGHDLGYVGQVRRVNADVVLEAIENGQVPVVSPISADEKGASYNVNADSAAAALAAAAHCSNLVFVTDVPGVVEGDKLVPSLCVDEAQALIARGTIRNGMVAKMEAAFEALNRNVPRVHILQWHGPATLGNIVNRKPMTGTTIHS